MRNDLMTLKEVCKETGVTRKIVQTYENYGLVKATTKNKYGYLLYDDAAVKKIKKIRLYQWFGYRLSEIAKLEYMTVDEQVMILKEKINNMYDNQSETAELIEMAEQLLENLRSHYGGYIVMKENEKEIFIDEMADLGDEWTIEELKGTSYEKMSLERAIRERKSALGKMDGIIGSITF